jgi:hypothetical protein
MPTIGSKRRAEPNPARVERRAARTAIPTRIEMPHQPPAPVRLDTVQPERPVPPPIPVESERRIKTGKPVRIVIPPAPGHVDEIGQNS